MQHICNTIVFITITLINKFDVINFLSKGVPFFEKLIFFNFHYSSVYMYYNFSKWEKQQFRLILIFWLALEYATHFIILLETHGERYSNCLIKLLLFLGTMPKKCSFWRRSFPLLRLFTLSMLGIILWKS